MYKCGDCIHASLCKKIMYAFHPEYKAICSEFKHKDQFLEVVRCKECKWYNHKEMICNLHSPPYKEYPDFLDVDMRENDFCSYGKRRDNG